MRKTSQVQYPVLVEDFVLKNDPSLLVSSLLFNHLGDITEFTFSSFAQHMPYSRGITSAILFFLIVFGLCLWFVRCICRHFVVTVFFFPPPCPFPPHKNCMY